MEPDCGTGPYSVDLENADMLSDKALFQGTEVIFVFKSTSVGFQCSAFFKAEISYFFRGQHLAQTVQPVSMRSNLSKVDNPDFSAETPSLDSK